MIHAARFIEQSDNRAAWVAARRGAATATEVARAATPAGYADALADRLSPVEIIPNEYMRFGTESEPEIMRHAHRKHDILPSSWLIAAAENPLHMATPDGLSVDHQVIAECKTTGTDWASVPIKYRRQVQWQLYVTGAVRCLFLWQLRVPDSVGGFYLGWIEPKTLWVERDEKMIAELVQVADRLLEADERLVAA